MNNIITATAAAITSPEMYEKWLAYIQVSQKSTETYRRAIVAFLKWANSEEITQPTRIDLINYRSFCMAQHKAATANMYITAVRLFFSWLAQEGIYPNVAEHLKGIKTDRNFHKKGYLSGEQAHTVIANIDRNTLQGKRDFAMITLMLTTGLRTIEVSRANVADLQNQGNSKALFIQGKGYNDNAECVLISPEVETAIYDYLNARKAKASEPLFTSLSHNNGGQRMTTRSISGIAKDAMKAAGFNSDRLTAHSFRHTAGTLALMNGASLEQVQQMLRHASINTTMIYMHGIDRAKNDSELKVAAAIF